MSARLLMTEDLKADLVATSSYRALKVGYFSLSSLDHDGTSDHRASSRRRTSTPVLRESMTTGTGSVGRMFQLGRQSCTSPPVATNSSMSSLTSLSIAKRPHIPTTL